MKTKTALSVFASLALLPACTTTTTTTKSTDTDYKTGRYASSEAEPAPPAEGPDIPAQGPADPLANPAYVPSPLLRTSAASSP
jgi:hypothetical protein